MSDTPQGMPRDDRPRYTYKVPDSKRSAAGDPHTVTLVALRVSEEIECEALAAAKSGSEPVWLTEAIRRSVVAVDGKPIDWSSPGGPEWYERTSAPVRNLIKKAFKRVNTAGEAAERDFLGSESVELS